MKKLNIGNMVIVSAIAHCDYDDKDNRVVYRTMTRPFLACVTGLVRRYTGKYHQGTQGGMWGDDYEPPTLKPTGSVLLWELRIGMTNKPVYAMDDDVQFFRTDETLPMHVKPSDVIIRVSEEPPLLLLEGPTRAPAGTEAL